MASKSWREAKEDLESTTLFLVHQTGPTVYQIKDELENSFRVIIGSTHTCTCKEKGFCMHILFVLLKVLRIPLKNHLSQKMGFTDAEIDVALAGNFEERVRPKRQPLIKKKVNSMNSAKEEEEGTVDRQILNDDEEEVCPICQDDMKKEHALTWCRKGCGNNIHAKCMKMYAQYKSTTKKDILCPLCRENWGPMAIHIINDDCKGKASLKKACANVTCSSCTFQIRGDFSRCVECSIYGSSVAHSNNSTNNPLQSKVGSSDDGPKPVDFCKTCFKNIGRVHAKHHFVTSTTNATVRDFAWEYVKNPRAPQQLISADLLENLQNRELTTDDYDMLLELDKPKVVSLQDTLISALHSCKSNLLKCWCGTDVTSGTAKSLVCGHAAHIECCREKLNEAIEEGFWKLEEMKCPHVGCDQPLFQGLARRRKKVVKNDVNNEPKASGEGSRAMPCTGFMIAGAGIGATATGVAAPLYNERSGLSLEVTASLSENSTTRTGADNVTSANTTAQTQRRGVAGEGVMNGSTLVIQSGALPPRHSSRTAAKRGSTKPTMRRGLALSGHGQSIRRPDVAHSAIDSSNSARFNRGQSTVDVTNTIRSTSASAATADTSRGTSSFAPANSKRRVTVSSSSRESLHDGSSGNDGESMLQVTSSSTSQLHTGGQRGHAGIGTDAPPIGMVVPRQKPRRSHVARIRGLVGGIDSSTSPETAAGSVQMCLNVNHY